MLVLHVHPLLVGFGSRFCRGANPLNFFYFLSVIIHNQKFKQFMQNTKDKPKSESNEKENRKEIKAKTPTPQIFQPDNLMAHLFPKNNLSNFFPPFPILHPQFHLNPLLPQILLLLHKTIPLPNYGLPNHNIQLNNLLRPLQINLPLRHKPHLPINDQIHLGRTLQIASPSFLIGLGGDLGDELFGVTFAAGSGSGADVDEVPRLQVTRSEDGCFCAGEEGQEFGEEADFGFRGELVV